LLLIKVLAMRFLATIQEHKGGTIPSKYSALAKKPT
jgi:hypothetical protein